MQNWNYLSYNIIFSNYLSISNFILKEQLKINNLYDIVFECIPYDQFDYIKEVRKDFATAVWKNGSLEYNSQSKKYEKEIKRKSCFKVFI